MQICLLIRCTLFSTKVKMPPAMLQSSNWAKCGKNQNKYFIPFDNIKQNSLTICTHQNSNRMLAPKANAPNGIKWKLKDERAHTQPKSIVPAGFNSWQRNIKIKLKTFNWVEFFCLCCYRCRYSLHHFSLICFRLYAPITQSQFRRMQIDEISHFTHKTVFSVYILPI